MVFSFAFLIWKILSPYNDLSLDVTTASVTALFFCLFCSVQFAYYSVSQNLNSPLILFLKLPSQDRQLPP